MYNYNDVKQNLFTDDGQKLLLRIRDFVKEQLLIAGAVRMEEVMKAAGGDTWEMLACVDRLVELGEIAEVTAGKAVSGQHRIFVKA